MGTARAEVSLVDELLNEQLEIPTGPVMDVDTSALAQHGAQSKVQAMAEPIYENNYVDNTGIAVGSLPHDSFYSVKAYAKSKFPNLDLNEAVGRFAQKDGRIYYLGMDNKLYWATPDFKAVKSDIRNIDEWASKGVGPAIPIAMGTGGAIVSGGNPIIAGGAGMTGEAIRQTLSHQLTGEEMSLPKRAINVGTAGLTEGVGTVGGNLLNGAIRKVITKLPARVKNFEIGDKFAQYSTKLNEKLVKLSEKFGIDLTTAERSADGRLIKLQKVLGETKGADEILEAFYKIRNKDVQKAVYNAFMKIAEKDIAPDLAFKEAIKSSKVVLKGEERILIDKASAHYEKAFQVNNVNIQSTIDLVDELMKTAKGNSFSKLKQIRSMLFRQVDDPAGAGQKIKTKTLKENRLQSLDQVKREIDQILNVAGSTDNSIAKGNKVLFTKIKDSLLSNMDEASTDYATAREIYEHGMPALDQVKKGWINELAKQNENIFSDVGNMLLNSKRTSVADVKLAREMFFKYNKSNEWNQIVRGHLENVFESVLKEETVGQIHNLAGRFYNKVFSSGRQRAIIKESLKGLDGFGEDFADLMLLLNQTQKAMSLNSHTAWMQEAQKELLSDAKPMIASMIETLEIWKSPSRLSAWWTEIRKDKLAIDMAHMLTTKEGRKQLAKLREMPKNGKAIVMAFTHILMGGTFAEELEGDVEMGKFQEGRY